MYLTVGNLISSEWKEHDNEYPVDKVFVNGIAYMQSRLREQLRFVFSYYSPEVLTQMILNCGRYIRGGSLELYLDAKNHRATGGNDAYIRLIDDLIIDHTLYRGDETLEYFVNFALNKPTNNLLLWIPLLL